MGRAESFLISFCKVDFQNWINVCTETQNIFIQNRIWDLVWKSFPRLKLQGWLFTFPGSSLLPHRIALGLSRIMRNIYYSRSSLVWSFIIKSNIHFKLSKLESLVSCYLYTLYWPAQTSLFLMWPRTGSTLIFQARAEPELNVSNPRQARAYNISCLSLSEPKDRAWIEPKSNHFKL